MISKVKQYIKDSRIRTLRKSFPLQGDLSVSGCVKLADVESNEPLNACKALNARIQESKNLSEHFSSSGVGTAIHFNDVLQYYPELAMMIDENVRKSVKEYLGNAGKIDAVYLGLFNTRDPENTEVTNNSGIFHHDSVGNRIKLFIPINTNGNLDYPTVYMKGSNLQKWKTHANPLKHGVRIPTDIINKWEEMSVVVPFGGRYIFDTNGAHRGEYRVSNEYRAILQFEFSAAENLGFGLIGPNDFYMNSKSFDFLNNSGLLRDHICQQEKKNILHKGMLHRSKDASFTSLKMIEGHNDI
jgi:hypothetical protein